MPNPTNKMPTGGKVAVDPYDRAGTDLDKGQRFDENKLQNLPDFQERRNNLPDDEPMPMQVRKVIKP